MDHLRAAQIHLLGFRNIEQQSWSRFPAPVILLRGMRTQKDLIYSTPIIINFRYCSIIDFIRHIDGDNPSPYRRLIGNDDSFYLDFR